MKNSYSFLPLAMALTLLAGTQTACSAQGKDLRPKFAEYGITVKNQADRPTCSVHTMIGVYEFEYANTLGQQDSLSVEYMNWACNQIDGENYDGTMFSSAIDAVAKYGICTDDYMPYATRYSDKLEPSEAAKKDAESRKAGKANWIKEWDPNTGLTPEQLDAIRKELDKEHPVAIGFRWPKRTVTDKYLEDGTLVMQTPDNVVDGHSVLIVGYKNDKNYPGGGYLIFKNSYSESFGEKGYGKITYEYANAYANDAVTVHLK